MDQTRDGPIALSPDEVKGRNTWIVWSAGNDVMWDTLGDNSVGALDFLKVLSSHPSQKYSRACDPARLADGQLPEPVGVLRPGQRAVLREAHGA